MATKVEVNTSGIKRRLKSVQLFLLIFTIVFTIEISCAEEVFPELDKVSLVMPANGKITSKAGCRIDPISGNFATFKGLNIAAAHGSPIYAVADGKVAFIEPHKQGAALGNLTAIIHGKGWRSIYGHQSEFLVKAGDTVKAGQIIGRIGTTGFATGPVLSFFIINPKEEAVNPIALLFPEKNYELSIRGCSE